MNDLYLIFKNLTRNRTRFILNSFAVFTAFFLFGLLGALKGAFDAGIELSADNRLIVVNKINFTQPLPIAYVNKIKAIDGVKDLTYANWFGAYHQDQRKPIVGFAVDPQSYLAVYEELQLSTEERENWFNERQGMVVGEALAKSKGWQIGDRVPISSNIFSKEDGSHVWDMIISGIFTAKDKQADTNYLMFHYKYFIETQTFGSDWIGWLILTTDNSDINAEVAKSIDALFANSAAETETSTEKAFNKAFIEQIGSIGLIISSVVLAAFFTILLIVGNAMALAVRERTQELAVLKTLGFPSWRIFRMVLSESVFLSALGGVLGMLLAYYAVSGLSNVPQIRNMLPNLVMTSDVVATALVYILMLGFVTGFFPAWRAMKLNTIDALSRG
ncbi:ABC transporter permease [Agarilytica rhodophyticola]|uniref:ABC transporter permease n=1 Tax=Agarilytica rhodophyticola TaxID=1737490 RepID=UPI000B349077|nr:FtsX-like permease family protein [Agarilytica rhodophyticola]